MTEEEFREEAIKLLEDRAAIKTIYEHGLTDKDDYDRMNYIVTKSLDKLVIRYLSI